MDAEQTQILQAVLRAQPVAALATLHKGEPAASMVPCAWLPAGRGAVIHVSRLATHTADMLAHPAVALLVTGTPEMAPMPQALPRVSLSGPARPCLPDDPLYAEARACYLARFPDSEEMFSFGDFSLFVITPGAVRFVAGFGRAHGLTPQGFAVCMSA